MKILMTRLAIVASAALATMSGAEAAYTQGSISEAAYVHRHQAAPAQANPQTNGSPRVTPPNSVVTGNRVIGRDPDPFIQEEMLRHYDSGRPD